MPQLPADQGAIQAIIEDYLDSTGKTRYRLAKDCELAPGRIYRILRRPTTSTIIERLLRSLGAQLVIGQFVYYFGEEDGDGPAWRKRRNKAGRRPKGR